MVIDLKTKSPVPTDTYDGHFGRVDGRRHAGRGPLGSAVVCGKEMSTKNEREGDFHSIFSIRVLHTC